MRRRPTSSTRTVTRFPYTTLFRSHSPASCERSGPPRERAEPAVLQMVGGAEAGEVQRPGPPDHGRRDQPWPDRWLHGSVPEAGRAAGRSEEHTSELQSLMRISYAVFCLKKKMSTLML